MSVYGKMSVLNQQENRQMSGLNEALKSAGITKKRLAEILQVNEKTVRRMGDGITPEVKEVLSQFMVDPDKADLRPGIITYMPSVAPVVRTIEGTTPQYKEKINPAPPIKWQDKPISMFDGKGRGVPVDGFVLISMGSVADDMPECQVVTQDAWLARLKQTCTHGFKGWTCKKCLH